MRRVRVTRRDPELPHQIALNMSSRGRLLVSCNCLGRHGRGQLHMHFGEANNLEEAWELYDNSRHKGSVPFVPGDRGQQEYIWVRI